MSAAFPTTAHWRTSEWYAARARRLSIVVGATGLALALAYAVAVTATEGEVLLVVPLVAALVTIAVLAYPPVGVYIAFGAALLFEQFYVAGVDPITARSRIFENISSYTALPLRLSVADLLIGLILVSWAARSIVGHREAFRMGVLGRAVAAYGGIFVLGLVVGIARGRGWNADAAFAELRGPAYLCLMYFVAANLIRTRAQLTVIVWEFLLLVGVKALQGILNYLDSLNLATPLDVVTSHEDVIFFDAAIALFIVMIALGMRTKLMYALLALQPLILGAEILTQRRVGFIALATVLLALLILLFTISPRRALTISAVGVLAAAAYVGLFWDATGPAAEPVRALRTVVDPGSISLRDQASNGWRDIENSNIAFTMRQLPLTGVGVGQQYIFHREPPPLTGFTYWRYTTHNAVLWLWLKAGPLGAFALWFLVARVLLVGAALHERLRDPRIRWMAVVPISLVICQLVFSSVDLGMTYSRTMIVLGVALGMVAILAEFDVSRAAPRALTASAV